MHCFPAMADASGTGGEAGIGCQLRCTRDFAESLPQGIVGNPQDQRLVHGFKHLVRAQRLVTRAGPGGLGAALPVALQEITQEP